MSPKTDLIQELTIDAKAKALNAALEANRISSDRIVAVVFVPGSVLAGGQGDQYRVLYKG